MDNIPIVFDNGSFYTKMGFCRNINPDFIIPTTIADFPPNILSIKNKNEEYNNFFIGEEAIKKFKDSKIHKLLYPVSNKFIENWDLMEKFWKQSIYYYLRADPTEHFFLLTEPPLNHQENREKIAEIFFETFNVPGLYIGMDSFFGFIGAYKKYKKYEDSGFHFNEFQEKAMESMTGILVDSGDQRTNIVPVCEGQIKESNIKTFPVVGKSITKFIEQMIKDRKEIINTEDLSYAVNEIKEKECYLAEDVLKEFSNFDKKINIRGKLAQSKKFKKCEGIGKISGNKYSINLGYETFLGPELFFSPNIIESKNSLPLDEVIDLTIQKCPIKYRKRLYSNIILIGGNTLFRHLDIKLKRNLQNRVDERLKKYRGKSSIEVNVFKNITNDTVWLGGSSFSSNESFRVKVHTREEYLEKGPSCCRFTMNFIENSDLKIGN